MNQLFCMDFENYDPQFKESRRDSSRAIIIYSDKKNPPFNLDDKIALVYATKLKYFKFPGGGINPDESKEQALIREVAEEVGLHVIPESIKEYGVAGRYQKSDMKEKTVFVQDSFYYFCQVEETKDRQNLDSYEAEAGFELRLVTIREAIELNNKYSDEDSFNNVMIARETAVLQMLAGQDVEPTKTLAEFLLVEGVKHNPGPWGDHSRAVAKAAEKMAAAIQANGGSMDPKRAYIYGLLHDIGRRVGFTYMAHVIDGYEYLIKFGYKNAARICITHSFNNQDYTDYIGKRDLTEERQQKIARLLKEKELDDYDRLIQLLDSTCGADGTQNLETRMNDVKARYGSYPKPKWDKNFQLKDYFEKLMGKDFYEVIK